MNFSKVEYIISAVDITGYPDINNPEFAFLGRSNVGKSSFINAYTNRKNLAYTSSKPGKTQTINFFNVDDVITLVDLPGYGYASKSLDMRLKFGEIIENYLTKRKNLKCVFLILDIRHEPTNDDLLMYKYLIHFNIPVYLIATKADKIGKTLYLKQKKLIKNKLEINNENDIIIVSSYTKIGFDKVQIIIDSFIKKNE